MHIEPIYNKDGSVERMLVNNIPASNIMDACEKELSASRNEENKGIRKFLPKFLKKTPPVEITFQGVKLIISETTPALEIKEKFEAGKKELINRQSRDITDFEQSINKACLEKDAGKALKLIYVHTNMLFDNGLDCANANSVNKYTDIISSKKDEISSLLEDKNRQKFISDLDDILNSITSKNERKLTDANKRIVLTSQNTSENDRKNEGQIAFNKAISDIADECSYINAGNIGKNTKDLHTKFVYNITRCVTNRHVS